VLEAYGNGCSTVAQNLNQSNQVRPTDGGRFSLAVQARVAVPALCCNFHHHV
jgi:hypothetical protein